MPIAQESWIVIEGRVEVTYFDLDDSILKKVIINCSLLIINYLCSQFRVNLWRES